MRRAAILLPLMLAACGGRAVVGPPAVSVVTQRVEVPVPVACVKKSAIRPEPDEVTLAPDEHAVVAADILGAKAKELRAWGRSLRATLLACAD